jgi:hypothetical protein
LTPIASGLFLQPSDDRGLPLALPDRFRELIHLEPGLSCWFWLGETSDQGYARYRPELAPGRCHWRVRGHKFAFELLRGEIADGLVRDHLCRIRRCVNPYHLEPVPQAINVQRGIRTKLYPEAVGHIRDLRAAGLSWQKIADIFGVTKPTVRDAGQGRSWRITDATAAGGES